MKASTIIATVAFAACLALSVSTVSATTGKCTNKNLQEPVANVQDQAVPSGELSKEMIAKMTEGERANSGYCTGSEECQKRMTDSTAFCSQHNYCQPGNAGGATPAVVTPGAEGAPAA